MVKIRVEISDEKTGLSLPPNPPSAQANASCRGCERLIIEQTKLIFEIGNRDQRMTALITNHSPMRTAGIGRWR
jgi:hypothetical protein